MNSAETVSTLDASVSHDAIERNARDHFRDGLGIAVACVALFSAVYVCLPAEAQTDLRDFVGFAGEGYGDGLSKVNDFSDGPVPVNHDNPFGRAAGETHILPMDIATAAG